MNHQSSIINNESSIIIHSSLINHQTLINHQSTSHVPKQKAGEIPRYFFISMCSTHRLIESKVEASSGDIQCDDQFLWVEPQRNVELDVEI